MNSKAKWLGLFILAAVVLLALSARAVQATGPFLFADGGGFAAAAEAYPPPDTTPAPTDPAYPGPGQPSATPTRTPTQVPPSATPTRTPTQVPPSATPTRTPTQVPPSATPTQVPPSATPEHTPTQEPPGATPEHTPTQTPTATTEVPRDPGPTPQPTATVELRGQVTAINGDVWTIGDQQVQVNADTQLRGSPTVGDTVLVKACLDQNGTLIALKIEKKNTGSDKPAEYIERKVTLRGVLKAINGEQWTVGDQVVLVTGATQIQGGPAVGDTLKVEARKKADGSLVAEKISITKTKPIEKPRDRGNNENKDRDRDYNRDDRRRDRRNP